MNIMTKILKLFILSVFIFSILSTSNFVVSQNSITDPSDDVGQIAWGNLNDTSQAAQPTYKTVTNQPNIDILSASYTKNNNGSVTLELIVKGVIIDDNHTFYQVNINNANSTGYFELNAVFGYGYSGGSGSSGGVNVVPNTQFAFTNSTPSFNNAYNFKNGYGILHTYTQNSHLFMTLNNNITASTIENSTVVSFPDSIPDSWGMHILTWEGDNYLLPSGNWYLDYYPNTDNPYTKLPSPVSPGFEIVSIIAIPVLAITLRKLKIKKI